MIAVITWYNGEHRHVGIGLLTPEMVYRGRGEEVPTARQVVLDAAHAAHPEALRAQATGAASPAGQGVDQPAEGGAIDSVIP